MTDGAETLPSNPSSSKPRTPPWAFKACKAYIRQSEIHHEVLNLCVRGLGMVTAVPTMISALAQEFDSPEEAQEEKIRADHFNELALREIASGFSLLHSQWTVSLWGALESLVKDITRDWICNKPDLLHEPPWANLKVRIGDYEPLDAEQRAEYLVELADQSVSGVLKQGVTRFERLLETIGLDGNVPDPIRQPLFELQQVRNLLVHRQGIADQRFCRACPWLNLHGGDRLEIRHERYSTYTRRGRHVRT